MSLQPPTPRPSFLRSISSSSVSSIITAKDKPRLYIALYPRGGSLFQHTANCDSFHWSIIIGPQTAARSDPGTRYHIQHGHGDHQYFYEEQDFGESTAQTLLVRVTVAKVVDEARVRAVLRDVPFKQGDEAENCLTWVKKAYVRLIEDGKCVKGYVYEDDWADIERCARRYGKKKREMRRFQDSGGPWDMAMVPTWNFWENRETTP